MAFFTEDQEKCEELMEECIRCEKSKEDIIYQTRIMFPQISDAKLNDLYAIAKTSVMFKKDDLESKNWKKEAKDTYKNKKTMKKYRNIKPEDRKPTTPKGIDKEALLADLQAGMKHEAAAKKYGIAMSTLQYHVNNFKKQGLLPQDKRVNQVNQVKVSTGEKLVKEIDDLLAKGKELDKPIKEPTSDSKPIENLKKEIIVKENKECEESAEMDKNTNTETGVIHPNHYNTTNYECWDVYGEIVKEYKLEPVEAVMFFNVFKYIWRYKRKDGVKDLKKAANYLNKLIEEVEENNK